MSNTLSSTANSNPASHLIRALLVDDNESIRRVIESYLVRTGRVEVVGHAADGVEAVEAVTRLKPDLVIMDIHMPSMNGIEATRRIKQLPEPPRVIIVSLAGEYAWRSARAAGADALCDKTDIADKLVQKFSTLFPSKD